MIPKSRPQMSRARAEKFLSKAKVTTDVALIGVRGYYLRTMGDPKKNDRAVYDDALFVISPEAYVSFNANCDPGYFRKGIASLKPGVWLYKLGTHGLSRPESQRYEALVQAGEVTVERDGEYEDRGWFGINIHKGSRNSVSSLGCQTIPPTQWEAFIALVKSELKRRGQKTVPYLLLENKGDIA